MRVGVDYTAAIRQDAGIGRYTRELLKALVTTRTHAFAVLAAVAGRQPQWLEQRAALRSASADQAQLSFYGLGLTDDWLARIWQRLRLPLLPEWLMGHVDLFFSPDFVLPPLRKATRALLTVHDLSFLRHPETFPRPLRNYLEQAVPRSIQRADHVLADSFATRQDLADLLGVPENRVSVLHLGVDQTFSASTASDEAEVLYARYGVARRPYILAVGTLQPRKNYIRLMEACDPLTSRGALDLVIVGRPAWMSAPILEAAALRPYVHILGFAADGDLPALYRQARLLAFPSLYEGFGLPPLEAMACGTPVVASAASSIPEAVGDAGLLLDPLDTQLWTDTIYRVLNEPELRHRLRAAGLARVQMFTWERAATEWLRTVDGMVS